MANPVAGGHVYYPLQQLRVVGHQRPAFFVHQQRSFRGFHR